MKKIHLVILIAFIGCDRTTDIDVIQNNIVEFNLLKNLVLENIDTIESQVVKSNQYSEVYTLGEIQVNSLLPISLKDSINVFKEELGINSVILINKKCILFELKEDHEILKTITYYMVYSSDSLSKEVIKRNFYFENKYDLGGNWVLSKKTKSLAE